MRRVAASLQLGVLVLFMCIWAIKGTEETCSDRHKALIDISSPLSPSMPVDLQCSYAYKEYSRAKYPSKYRESRKERECRTCRSGDNDEYSLREKYKNRKHALLEKLSSKHRCGCGYECTCGCQEGFECTCSQSEESFGCGSNRYMESRREYIGDTDTDDEYQVNRRKAHKFNSRARPYYACMRARISDNKY